MKKLLIILLITHYSPFIGAQDIPPTTEQQLENLTDIDQNETEDDSYLQQFEHFKKHPLNLNEATANELKEFLFLNDLQIANLISYRNLLGKFISIYELQSIPGWDLATIKKIISYITVDHPISIPEDFEKRLSKGDHGVLLRYAEILEKVKGFDKSTTGTKYLGSRERIFFRYRYQYKNLLQYGIVGDKDAGEQYFKSVQKYGFDFYSFHWFARKIGKIQSMALGDFTVNMGQGLIQWQSLAFKKSADVMGIKRQSAILRPYNSSGEFYFHRGAGITAQFRKIEATAYASIRKLSANFVADTITNEDFISSFLNSGYHRTQNEIDDRNNLRQLSFGGNLTYRQTNWHVGINSVFYHFSLPVQKRDEPYNLFGLSGKSWNNFSIDYSYTFRNFHFFGETATDKNLNKAFLSGLLISVDPRVDLSIAHREINKGYQAVYGNAFTENTYPTNEKGLYAGITLRPVAGWQLAMYADFYKFPWLKYTVDAPSYGKDFLVLLTFIPNKQVEIYSRFRNETKQFNMPDNSTVTNYLVLVPKQSWRTQLNYKINASIILRSRIELLWYNKKDKNTENGFLNFFDLVYRPLKPYSGNIRLQYFETSGYNSRIYAYENDILYSYSIPAFFDKGYRYYVNFNYDIEPHLSIWLRWAQTIYRNKSSIGSELDEIPGNHRSEIKVQGLWVF
ncbi:MAG TPA: helix-hairpin-helix domain-containing protein [Chitinophagaceae bacterium]|nr:helix-hairpin-helix domain-containing protein [Chitinophagaceae bacterium]